MPVVDAADGKAAGGLRGRVTMAVGMVAFAAVLTVDAEDEVL